MKKKLLALMLCTVLVVPTLLIGADGCIPMPTRPHSTDSSS